MLPTLLVLVSLALVVCLGLLIFGRGAPPRSRPGCVRWSPAARRWRAADPTPRQRNAAARWRS